MRGLQSCEGVVQCGNPVLRTLPASATRGQRCFCPPSCSLAGSKRNPNIIKVVVNGVGSESGKAAVVAIHKARGMELAGAVDSKFQGKDAGLQESLEIPILNDIVMVLGSVSQRTSLAVFVDLGDPAGVFENVRQATAFGLKSVVGVPRLRDGCGGRLSSFCDKASTVCIVAPSLSIGAVLLQQAAAAAAFQYNHVEIIESEQGLSGYPSQQATQLASSVSGLGQTYNDGNDSNEFSARGVVVGDGVRTHSMALPGLVSSLYVRFAGPGETLSIRHDVTGLKALMSGLILAIRRVVCFKVACVCAIFGVWIGENFVAIMTNVWKHVGSPKSCHSS